LFDLMTKENSSLLNGFCFTKLNLLDMASSRQLLANNKYIRNQINAFELGKTILFIYTINGWKNVHL